MPLCHVTHLASCQGWSCDLAQCQLPGLPGSSNYSDLILFLSSTTNTEGGGFESEGLQMVSDNNNWYLETIGKGRYEH